MISNSSLKRSADIESRHFFLLPGQRQAIVSAFLPFCLFFVLFAGPFVNKCSAAGPYQATGIKIGEVTATSAIIWTRCTKNEAPNTTGSKPTTAPSPSTVDQLFMAVPGAAGQVRLVYWDTLNPSVKDSTDWLAAQDNMNYTRQFLLQNLQPNTKYMLESRSRAAAGATEYVFSGRFKTAPLSTDPVKIVFTAVTGQTLKWDNASGSVTYTTMKNLKPDFFVHTGDIIYQNHLFPPTDSAHCRFKWDAAFGQPLHREFFRNNVAYFEKDDHDVGEDDCYPGCKNMGNFTFQQGLYLFNKVEFPFNDGLTYRTVRWGKDLQIWLLEGRDYRSSNEMADGPNKSILGTTQKAWLKSTAEASDATFRVIFSPTPIVGPDRPQKSDNLANANWKTEGDEIRLWASKQKNMVVVCGDRHWQYASVDKVTGLSEYSTGPVLDDHAGGWDYGLIAGVHKYLQVKGGFLSGTVQRANSKVMLIFKFHEEGGAVRWSDTLRSDIPVTSTARDPELLRPSPINTWVYPEVGNIVFNYRMESPDLKIVDAELCILDQRGRCVKTFRNSGDKDGMGEIAWNQRLDNGSMLGTGAYIYNFRVTYRPDGQQATLSASKKGVFYAYKHSARSGQ